MTRGALLVLCLIAIAGLAVPMSAQAQAKAKIGKETSLPIPRYVSIRADEANLRVGPGGAYPIRWRLLRAGMPARIVDEEGQWREIVLHDGERGWLHAPLLSGARSLYVTADRAPIMTRAGPDADVAAYAEAKVILRVKGCGPEWCEIRKGGVSGWIARGMVWGLAPNEIFE